MNYESWNKWLPDNNLSKKCYKNEVIDGDNLFIGLSDDYRNSFGVTYNCIVESYKCLE